MNIDLALNTLVDLPFEEVLESIKKIKDENKRLRERDKKMLKRFDECIDLLNSHYKLNKELRETSQEKTKEISELTNQNTSLSIILYNKGTTFLSRRGLFISRRGQRSGPLDFFFLYISFILNK